MHPLFVNNWFQNEIAQALSRTLLHSLWQGLLMAVIAGIILFVTKKSTAALRYNLLTGLFLLFVITVGATFFREWNTTGNAASPVFIKAETVNSSTSTTATGGIVTGAGYIETLLNYLDEHAPLIVSIWMLFVLVHFIKLLSGLHYIHRIRHKHVFEATDEWKLRLENLKDALGIHQKILLLQSGIVKVPAVVGITKPLILVPLSLLSNLPASYVESILLHELAHIRRKDFGVNLLQSAMEMIFFFNPALLWISSCMREEREACCDDIVLAQGGDKKSYLEALIYFQDQHTTAAPYAMALQGNKNYLLTRVKRMLTHENKKLTIMEKNILAIGLIGLSALAFVPQSEKQILPVKPAVAVEVPVQAVVVKEIPHVVSIAPTKPIVALPIKAVTTPKQVVEPVPVVRDTVPKKMVNETRSTSTSVYIDDDGTKTSEITTSGNDGKTYRVKKVNGVITEFMVDGKTIAKEDMGNYQQVLDDIERRQIESDKQRAIADEKRKVADQKRREMDAQRRDADAQRREMDAQRVTADKQRRKVEQQRIVADEKRREMSEQRVRSDEKRRETNERRQEADEIRQEARAREREAQQKRKEAQKSDSEISVIVQDLINQKIIKAGDPLTFTLNNQELTVNGTRQDAALHQKLKEKHSIGATDLFQYQSDNKGTTRATVVRN